MRTTIVLTLLALFGGFRSTLQLEPGAEPWRILTCHFTHWTYEQLAWDALAFLTLGIACERRHRAAFHATLLASAVTVPLAVLAFAPEVIAYRGLSGLASALFWTAAAMPPLSKAAALPPQSIVLMLAFIAKTAYEMFAGQAVFAGSITPVPVAHIAGAITALLVTTVYTRIPCVSSSPCSSR